MGIRPFITPYLEHLQGLDHKNESKGYEVKMKKRKKNFKKKKWREIIMRNNESICNGNK